MTKNWIGLAAVTLMILAAPAFAEKEAKSIELTGFITDAWCGKSNANPEGADCARSCAKKGSELVIYAGGKIYKLDDKAAALQHIGYEVLLKGTLVSDGKIKITSITKAEDKSVPM